MSPAPPAAPAHHPARPPAQGRTVQTLAQVGAERLEEIENPELATRRARKLYKAKGYPDAWIEKRMRSIAIREELTGEWKNRGVAAERDYAILTAEISCAAFGITPTEYKTRKGSKPKTSATT
jgi:hypothetical protein